MMHGKEFQYGTLDWKNSSSCELSYAMTPSLTLGLEQCVVGDVSKKGVAKLKQSIRDFSCLHEHSRSCQGFYGRRELVIIQPHKLPEINVVEAATQNGSAQSNISTLTKAIQNAHQRIAQ